MEVVNRYIVIKRNIDGAPQESDFELKCEAFSLSLEPGKRDVIIKNLYLSIDPYQFNRMKNQTPHQRATNFAGDVTPGKSIDGYGVGRVVVSGNPEYEKDDLVSGLLSWGEYSIMKEVGGMLRKVDNMGFPISYHVGILAFSGLTAYAGFFELCKPKKGEKVFVSAASGSVGNLVGQYAKLFGCYVVGCAGSPQKRWHCLYENFKSTDLCEPQVSKGLDKMVSLLKEKLGFDEAFNYKEETDLNSTLKRYFPDGIDIYFDNVGAEILEAAVNNMNAFGRIAVCGVISEYTDNERRAALNMVDVVYKRIRIQGFLVGDHFNVHNDFLSTTVGYLQTGKMHVLEDISHGVESIPSAFVGLFQGNNVGKKLVQLSDD